MIDLSWKDEYLIKNDRINEEHKNLFVIANKAFSMVNPEDKATKIKAIVKELIIYTQTHFEHEENLMKSIKFPTLEEHKEKHKAIILLMHKFIRDMSSMKVNEIEKELAHDIEIWFVHHIITEDKKISIWIDKNGIPESSFSWKNEYAIGDEFIDEGYNRLLEQFNLIYTSTIKENPIQDIKNSINSIITDLSQYFSEEEVHLASLGYDKIENHKTENKSLLNKLKDIKQNISDEYDINDALYDFIENDFINHMCNAGKKISSWKQFYKDLKESRELNDL